MPNPTPPESDHTQGGELTEHIYRRRKRFQHVAILTPINADKIGGAEDFRLNRGEMVIGRDVGCDATIAELSVSRRQAKVGHEENDFFIKVLGSRNGPMMTASG